MLPRLLFNGVIVSLFSFDICLSILGMACCSSKHPRNLLSLLVLPVNHSSGLLRHSNGFNTVLERGKCFLCCLLASLFRESAAQFVVRTDCHLLQVTQSPDGPQHSQCLNIHSSFFGKTLGKTALVTFFLMMLISFTYQLELFIQGILAVVYCLPKEENKVTILSYNIYSLHAVYIQGLLLKYSMAGNFNKHV